MSGITAHDHSWQSKEKAEELYGHQKESEQAIKRTSEKEETQKTSEPPLTPRTTAQDRSWQSKERAEEVFYARQKEREQLEAIIKRTLENEETQKTHDDALDFEGGYGGQERSEDRYATTYGAH